MQEAHQIGEDRGAKAWRDLLGDGRSADDVPPFQDQHLQAGAREIIGADQPVMSRADDDRVVALAEGDIGGGLAVRFVLHRAPPLDALVFEAAAYSAAMPCTGACGAISSRTMSWNAFTAYSYFGESGPRV